MFTNEQYTCLVKKYIDTVFRVALNYTKNPTDAEDIVQNVFLKLLREKKEFVSDDHIRNWLIRVAVNEGKNMSDLPGGRLSALRTTLPHCRISHSSRRIFCVK